ncbi:branched-chain amino acid ABC transporter permease [Roseovarius pelagicus]|uniref:Branched-chain amino acid ABC transporter permease n=1 Tax=Roseovarius pelagicus TaxID=2980108 RepID=A0ABY6DCB3_9RHOB|nr:branched-chain amino acid ABC transporter permease [Roseovarius pelagicus]UXX81485.1 branched-chain amino acid ABC transporter permease [Roseovarius pelagicus]
MPGFVEIVSQLTNGLIYGLILSLVAVGFSLVLGVMGIINFAHGLLFALGAYLAFTLQFHVGYFGALVIAPLIVGMIGILMEYVFIRRLYGRDPLFVLVLTFGVAMAGEEIIQLIWGKLARSVDAPAFADSYIDLGFIIYSEYRLFMALVAALIIGATWYLLAKSPLGSIIRAGTHDPEMVSILGMNLPLIRTAVFGFTALLGGAAGVVAAPLWSVRPTMGLDALLPAFLIVVIGGMGSFWGSVLGGILVGVANAVSVMFFPRFADLTMYVLAAVVLLYWPRGLLGKKSVLE